MKSGYKLPEEVLVNFLALEGFLNTLEEVLLGMDNYLLFLENRLQEKDELGKKLINASRKDLEYNKLTRAQF